MLQQRNPAMLCCRSQISVRRYHVDVCDRRIETDMFLPSHWVVIMM